MKLLRRTPVATLGLLLGAVSAVVLAGDVMVPGAGKSATIDKQLADEGMTMLVVTHEMQFGERVADRVVMFDEGVILEQGPPDKIFHKADSERTRRFLNQLHWDA